MAETCCLCSSNVSSGTMKTKRRKVIGEATRLAVEVIDNLAKRSFMKTLSSTVGSNAYYLYCWYNADRLSVVGPRLVK